MAPHQDGILEVSDNERRAKGGKVTYDELIEACEREWYRCEGDVVEVYLTEAEMDELKRTVPHTKPHEQDSIIGLTNLITGSHITLVPLVERLVVKRPLKEIIGRTYTMPVRER